MIWDYGNRCGHKRAEPRLRLTFEPKVRRPPFVRKVLSRCERFYFRRSALLRRHGICARSEAAEAIMLVVKALLLEWDQVTSRVGWRRSGDGYDGYLAGVPVKVIARWSGLNVSRVARALSVLMQAGLLQGSQPCEQLADGRWIGYPKVRRISWRLFYLLGFDENELRQVADAAQARRRAASSPAPAPERQHHREGEPTAAGDVLGHLQRKMHEQLERLGGRKPPDT
jgi:hypothetical protein